MIVAIYGSPRKNGNTDILMDNFLQPISEAGEEVCKIKLRELNLKPCIACGGCEKTGVCVFKDDIWDIYTKMKSARAVVLSSPIYFASINAQLKAVIDRSQAFWYNKYLLNNKNLPETEKSFFISVGGIKTDKYFKNAELVVKTYLNILDVTYSGHLFFAGVDGKGDIVKEEGALEKAVSMGREF